MSFMSVIPKEFPIGQSTQTFLLEGIAQMYWEVLELGSVLAKLVSLQPLQMYVHLAKKIRMHALEVNFL
jgi:hypothetical protein